MAYPTDLKYTKDHEWIRVNGDTAEIGITDYAQQQLGDVVYVELPDVGRTIGAGEPFGSAPRPSSASSSRRTVSQLASNVRLRLATSTRIRRSPGSA
jgi:glycine cleavage system H protein